MNKKQNSYLKNFTFVVAVRKGSQRIKNKNIRKFGNSSLLEIKLKQIRRIYKKANILLSTDCRKSLKLGKKYNTILDNREKKYCSNNIPMPKVYQYLAKKVKTKFVCYLHVTSPFLKDSTLLDALKKFANKNRRYDSVATVTTLKEYLWRKKKAINYNPNKHPRSQDLEGLMALNFAINIVSTKFMKNKGRIVGKHFIPVNLNFPENIDIDDKWQFIIGDLIEKKKLDLRKL